MAARRRVRSGVSFDPQLVQAVDRHAELLGEIGVTRSEVVNAILDEYFEGGELNDGVWEMISKRRIKGRS